MKNILLILFLTLLTISCSTDDTIVDSLDPFDISVAEDPLKSMWEELVTLSKSETCNDPAEWKFAAYGSKPCGGPWGYIAYSVKIDTADFNAKLEDFRIAQKNYNEEKGIMSDCAVTNAPTGIKCEAGKAILVY